MPLRGSAAQRPTIKLAKMFAANPPVLDALEELLRANLPAPEKEIGRVCVAVAKARPQSEEGARLRRLAFDLDNLLVETRWQIGEALLLMRIEPEALKAPEVGDGWGEIEREYGLPASALLLLRPFKREADRVYFSDPGEKRSGGTVAGWIYHMAIDNAVFRAVAALDRVAHLAWLSAGMPFSKRGRDVRVYFRSGKLKQVHDTLRTPESSQLFQLASDPFVEKLLAYRDGFSHTTKQYSRAAGAVPTDEWVDKEGKPVFQRAEQLDTDLLLGIAVSAYLHVSTTLTPLAGLLERQLTASQGS